MRDRKNKYSWEDYLREDQVFARRVGWSAGRWFLTIFLGLLALGGLVWGIKVAVAELKGAGDAHVQVNTAANRLAAQTKYNQLYEGIIAADKKINIMSATARSDFDFTNLQGATNVCLETVADYNRMSGDVLTAKWRPPHLPERVGETAETDCLSTMPVLTTPAAQ